MVTETLKIQNARSIEIKDCYTYSYSNHSNAKVVSRYLNKYYDYRNFLFVDMHSITSIYQFPLYHIISIRISLFMAKAITNNNKTYKRMV